MLLPVHRLLLTLLLAALQGSAASAAVPPRPQAPLAQLHAELDALLATQPSLGEPPTIILAGHHNDGKSALLESLLGVRLTHIGASTSTRRPLRVHAQHDPSCAAPQIYLQREHKAGGAEELVTVDELRQYIESENSRLAREGDVEEADIRVRVRWQSVPTVVVVDTPGLFSVSKGAGDDGLIRTSEAAERVLLSKLMDPSRLCLCLEDTADWALSPTRAVVRRADPTMCRTILVATKLDGKLAQFSMAEDLHRLLHPDSARSADPQLLGGPIFTSIPPTPGTSSSDLADAIARQESVMKALLQERLGSEQYADRIGIDALRRELQPHIDSRWDAVMARAVDAADQQVSAVEKEITTPPAPEVHGESIDDFAHRFCLAIQSLLRGSIALPAAEHGETLQQEQTASESGPLCPLKRPPAIERQAAVKAFASPRTDSQSDSAAANSVGDVPAFAAAAAAATSAATAQEEAILWLHATRRLYGGAQYWRALQEFMLGAAQRPEEEVTVEEIVNAMGVDGYHDGVNYMRAVCVIVIEKARGFFDSSLAKLRLRMLHVMSRMGPLASEVLALEAKRAAAAMDGDETPAPSFDGFFDEARLANPAEQAAYMAAITPIFDDFVARAMANTMEKCHGDVAAMTRYVSWDFNSPSKEALTNVLVQPIHEALNTRFQKATEAREAAAKMRGGRRRRKEAEAEGEFESYEQLITSFTETLMTRHVSEPMRKLLNELVTEIIRAWREEFCRAISIKLHSGFLLPFCEALPNYMRKRVAREAIAMGIGDAVPLDEATADGLNPRTTELRERLHSLVAQRQQLQQLSTRMHERLGASASRAAGPLEVMNNWKGGSRSRD